MAHLDLRQLGELKRSRVFAALSRGAIRQNVVAARGDLSGLSGTFGCSELDVAVDQLGVALAAAEAAGVQTAAPAYVAAKAFHVRQSGFWTGDWFLGSTSCRNLTNEAQRLTSALNGLTAQQGGATLPPSAPALPEGVPWGDVLGTVKWVGIAAAGIALAVMAAPIISTAMAAAKKAVKS